MRCWSFSRARGPGMRAGETRPRRPARCRRDKRPAIGSAPKPKNRQEKEKQQHEGELCARSSFTPDALSSKKKKTSYYHLFFVFENFRKTHE